MTWLKFALPIPLLCLVAASPDRVPKLDVKTTCHDRGALAGEAGEAAKSCMRDELGAKQELAGAWTRMPADIRRTCLDEVKIGGSPSYVELLTCSQMNEWSRQSGGGAPNTGTSAGAAAATGTGGTPARRAPGGAR